jgi:hypothetical protein
MARPTRVTLNLLTDVMAGVEITEIMLRDLLTNRVKEDTFLDYKHGNEIKDAKKGSATVREYISAFANADGGVLVIGVDESNWTITGAKAPGGISLEDWASDALTEIAGYLSPPPRFQTVVCAEGAVVMIAVLRSPRLVPHIAQGRLVYSLRMGDQTLLIPEYLLADLTLGRRQHPNLHVGPLVRAEVVAAEKQLMQNAYSGRYAILSIGIGIENMGFTWAEDIQSGLIYWAGGDSDDDVSLGRQMRSYLNVVEPSRTMMGPISLQHQKRSMEEIKALGERAWQCTTAINLPMRILSSWCTYVWRAAFYLLPKGFPISWYQLELVADHRFREYVVKKKMPLDSDLFSITHQFNSNPTVSLENIQYD